MEKQFEMWRRVIMNNNKNISSINLWATIFEVLGALAIVIAIISYDYFFGFEDVEFYPLYYFINSCFAGIGFFALGHLFTRFAHIDRLLERQTELIERQNELIASLLNCVSETKKSKNENNSFE